MRSLSNLYKQWFVRTEDTRVINSNELVTELMQKNVHHPVVTQEVPEDGEVDKTFQEGLMVEDLGSVIKAEPEVDYVQEAKEEAERILEEARAQAERLVQDANDNAVAIREDAKQQGYEEGTAAASEELSGRQAELDASYSERQNALEADYAKKRETMEHDLVDVILEVFNKVFHIQFDNKKDILMYLIDNAIMNIEGEKQFRIKVASGNVEFLENHKEEILDRVGHDIELEMIADSTMDGNDCIIETDSGVFDCSLGAQLENLIKDIRSLCS